MSFLSLFFAEISVTDMQLFFCGQIFFIDIMEHIARGKAYKEIFGTLRKINKDAVFL